MMIKFPDGNKAGIGGLDEVMVKLYQQNKPANNTTSNEMMKKLASRNYFPQSERHIYRLLLSEEYRRFGESKPKSEN